MHRLLRLPAAALLAAAAGCATLQTGAYYESGASLGNRRTFSFDTRDALPTGDARLDNNPFFDDRMRAAVEFEMGAKGLRKVDGNPDLLVHYHATVSQRMDVIGADTDRGYTDVTGREPAVIQFDEGTILVDVAEAATKRVIWRGWVRADVGGVLNDPHSMDAFIQKAVHKMFEQFLQP